MSLNVLTIDQSISNTGWNFFMDGTLIAFGSFGSKTGTKKDEKNSYVFHSNMNVREDENDFFESDTQRSLTKKDETDIFSRVRRSVLSFQKVLEACKNTTEEGDTLHVVFENLAFGAKGNATRDVAGLLFTMISSSLNFGEYTLVVPTSAKKVFTGDGKATKLDVINSLPEEVKGFYTEAGYKYSEKTGNGTMNDLADSYSFYKWYMNSLGE